ncbi:MAG: DUF1232 domain-containing protein [Flavobacteriales bacterium]|nr:DUF1232 domain-containing protein [Flavobacteriales bacterium]
MKRFLIILSGLLALVYLLNPTAGIFEFIPDNIPGVGNLDEGMAAYVLISVISYLTGKEFGLFGAKKKEDTKPKEIDRMPEGDSDHG